MNGTVLTDHCSVVVLRLPLAAVDAIDSYRRGMYGSPSSGGTTLKPFILVGIALVVLWSGLYAVDKFLKKRRRAAAPKRTLFGDLCSAHGLTAKERQYLEALAKQGEVQPAVAIFVRPELVEPLTRSGSQQDLWAGIHTKVYGEYA